MRVYDGSYGEGGGALLRLAISLSLVTQEPVRIINIRKKRPNPGLQTQHLVGLRALAEFCGGKLDGDSLGSETVVFHPANTWKSKLKTRVSTAGSLGLILQTLQIGILAVKNHSLSVEFEGGATFGKWSPSIPYINHVTWHIFRQMNVNLELSILRHGFYPKGGAQVTAVMRSPSILRGLDLDEFQKPKLAKIISYASKHLQRAKVAERQSETIKKALQRNNIDSEIINKSVEANNPGSGVLVFSKTHKSVFGGDFVGERKISAEEVGKKAYDRYIKIIKCQSVVDPFLADQILPVMAIASSPSVFSTPYLSNHFKTNTKLLKDFLGVTIDTEKIDNRFNVSIDV